MFFRKLIIAFSTIMMLFLIFAFPLVSAAEKMGTNEQIRVLYIGNSLTYTDSIPEKFKEIAESKGKSVYIDDTSLVKGSAPLNTLHNKANYKSTIYNNNWDYVILQEAGGFGFMSNVGSLEPSYDMIRIIDKDIKKAGAKTLLYSPALAGMNDAAESYTVYQSQSDWVHNTIASDIGAAVIPAGYTVASAAEIYDFKPLSRDNLHPSIIGAYITACSMYAAIFNESPIGGYHQQLEYSSVEDEWQNIQDLTWQSLEHYYTANSDKPCLRLSNNAEGSSNATFELYRKAFSVYPAQFITFAVFAMLVILILLVWIKLLKKRNKPSSNTMPVRNPRGYRVPVLYVDKVL